MPTAAEYDAMMERFAIRSRVEDYIDALNHRDWGRFGDTLAEDLVWTISGPFNVRLESRAAMLESVKTLQEPVYDFVFQMGHGIVVHELRGDFARVRHTMLEQSSAFMMIGIYYDELRKEADDKWRFTRRDFRTTYSEEGTPRGNIHRRLPCPFLDEDGMPAGLHPPVSS